NHFPEQDTSDSDFDYVALEHSEREPNHLEWLLDCGCCQVFHQFGCIRNQFVMFQGIVDIVVIEGLLMKKDIDEIGHVMIGHEVGQLKQRQVVTPPNWVATE
ncbi:hypothetical protein Tco_0392158, partial [Tanacetum coccineum]